MSENEKTIKSDDSQESSLEEPIDSHESSEDDWETCGPIFLNIPKEEIIEVNLPKPMSRPKKKEKRIVHNNGLGGRMPKPETECTRFVDALKKADKKKGMRRNYVEILYNKTTMNMSYKQLCKKFNREKDPATGRPV
jgi:hypothetical protein